MPNFDPFRELMEVERYKQNVRFKKQQVERANYQNALVQQQQLRQNKIQDNALARSNEQYEYAKSQRGAGSTQPFTLNPGDIRFSGSGEELARGGEKQPTRTGAGKVIKTQRGLMRDTGTGFEPILAPDKTPYMPPQYDPDNVAKVATAKATASKEAFRKAKLKAGYPKAKTALKSFQRSSKNIKTTIAEAVDIAKNERGTTGFLGMQASKIPGTDAYTLREKLKTIMSSDAFGYLQEMRNNSPTGGAVGQLSDSEREVMGLIKASLNQGLEDVELIKNLERISGLMVDLESQNETAFNDEFKEQLGGGNTGLKSKYGLE